MIESSGMADFAKLKREFRVEVTKKTNAREAIKGLPYFLARDLKFRSL